jgi:hypothetical protein
MEGSLYDHTALEAILPAAENLFRNFGLRKTFLFL